MASASLTQVGFIFYFPLFLKCSFTMSSFLWIYLSVWTVIGRLQSGQLSNSLSLSVFKFFSTTTVGSGSTGSTDSTGSFVIFDFRFCFCLCSGFRFNCLNLLFYIRFNYCFLNRLIINNFLYLVSGLVVVLHL